MAGMKRRTFVATVFGSVVAMSSDMALAQDSSPPNRPAKPKMSRPDYASTGVTLLPGTPAAAGFRMPAEWARHERTVMAFPTPINWRRRQLAGARKEWVDVAKAVARFEPVTLYANTGEGEIAKKLCAGSQNITVVEVPLDTAWTRDTGPQILLDAKGNRRATGFTFNCWGGKFNNFAKDALLKARMCKRLGIGMHEAPMVLEGGAITVDGEGTLIAVEECIIAKNRNPELSKKQIEKIMADHLGIKKFIWLARGLQPDPITDGHVDGICTFVKPGVVLLHTTADKKGRNYSICQDALQRLEAARDARGEKLKVIELPLTSENLVHMNFYICNGGIIVPVSGKKSEDDAPLRIIAKAFPDHEVVGVSGRIISEGGGGVHCITQQIPAGAKTR